MRDGHNFIQSGKDEHLTTAVLTGTPSYSEAKKMANPFPNHEQLERAFQEHCREEFSDVFKVVAET